MLFHRMFYIGRRKKGHLKIGANGAGANEAGANRPAPMKPAPMSPDTIVSVIEEYTSNLVPSEHNSAELTILTRPYSIIVQQCYWTTTQLFCAAVRRCNGGAPSSQTTTLL